MKKLRLIFMGTPDFAVPSLQALYDAGHDIVAVYSQPPRPAGRGHHIQKSPIHLLAEKLSIPVHTPKTLKEPEAQDIFSAHHADMAVVVAYGLILPQAILSAPRFGCLNIHGSILPRWRGAAPIQHAILAGDEKTGITIMQMDAGLDTGDILAIEKTPITDITTTTELYPILSTIGARLIVRTLSHYPASPITPQKQPSAGVTYAEKLTRADGLMDWTLPADILHRKIRALQPWPGTFFMMGNETIKIIKAEIIPSKEISQPGTILDKDFTIACGRDALRLITLQRAGKAAMDGAALLRGIHIAVGGVL